MRRETSLSGKCWMATVRGLPVEWNTAWRKPRHRAAYTNGSERRRRSPHLAGAAPLAVQGTKQAFPMTETLAVSTAPALSVRDLRKTYDNKVEALKGVSLDVREGDFFALLGPNGAGKSTLIGIVSSLVNLTSGSVSIFGTDLQKNRDAAMRLL